MGRAIVIVVLGALLGACVPPGSPVWEQRFAVDFHCQKVRSEQAAGSTYRVTGCGQSALYTCSFDTCVREHTDEEIRLLTRTGTATPGQTGSYGVVQRQYDEQQQMHVVRAKLWMSGLNELNLLGAPKQDLTAVHVQIVLNARQPLSAPCDALRVRVNDRPFDARGVRADQGAHVRRVSGTFDFEIFKPLGLPYAQLSVEACGRALLAGKDHMPTLVEFFEVYSQIAAEVRAEGQPLAKPAEGDMLEL